MVIHRPSFLSRSTLRFPWLRRLAQLGFWFFLIKGLLWLLIPAAAVYFGMEA